MLRSVDQWLRERHSISFVNLDLIFLCNKEGEGIVGLMKAVIENPLLKPEDKLVIALNNPLFSNNELADGAIIACIIHLLFYESVVNQIIIQQLNCEFKKNISVT